EQNEKLAGLRCLHNPNDYRNYINQVTSKEDPNKSGLIFCGSAFSKKVWEQNKFKDDIKTFEDKEWSLRVLKNGFDIEFSPSIFCYEIKRNRKQNFFRFKNEVIGSYQLWHHDYTLKTVIKSFFGSLFLSLKNFLIDIYYIFKK